MSMYSLTLTLIWSSSLETYFALGIIEFCVFASVNSLYSLYKFSMVYSGYRKEQPTFDCGLSWSDWSRSVQELRNIDSLTISAPQEYT